MSEHAKEHFILKGESYLIGKWISLEQESKKAVKNIRRQPKPYAVAQEMFSIYMNLDENSCVDIINFNFNLFLFIFNLILSELVTLFFSLPGLKVLRNHSYLFLALKYCEKS